MNTLTKCLVSLSVAFLFLSLGACSSNDKKDTSMVDSGTMNNTQSYNTNNRPISGGYEDRPVVDAMGRGTENTAGSAARTVYYFDFNDDTLTAQAKRDLSAQAEKLRGGDSAIRLEGHADERGTREYNMALSERRAKTVASYLQAQGISSSRFTIIGYGEEKPAVDGSSARSYALNRRVELKK